MIYEFILSISFLPPDVSINQNRNIGSNWFYDSILYENNHKYGTEIHKIF